MSKQAQGNERNIEINVTHNCHFSLVYLLGITRPRTTMKRIENHLCISLYLLLQERNSLYQKLWDSLYFKEKVDKHYTDYICRLSGFSLQLKLKVITKIQEWHREKNGMPTSLRRNIQTLRAKDWWYHCSIHVLYPSASEASRGVYFLQLAAYFCSAWMAYCVHLKK